MKASISILLGLFIIFICYKMIKREFNSAIIKANSRFSHINDANTKGIMTSLSEIENTVNELNRSFYEIVSELEGKYSIHDKEIEILTEKLEENFFSLSSRIEKNESNANNMYKKYVENKKLLKNASKLIDQNIGIEDDIDDLTEIKVKSKTKLLADNPDEMQDHGLGINEQVRIEKKYEPTIPRDTNDEVNSTKLQTKDSHELSDKVSIEGLDEDEKEQLRTYIIDLRHRGFSINQIAKKLGVGTGELQLVLNLQRK